MSRSKFWTMSVLIVSVLTLRFSGLYAAAQASASAAAAPSAAQAQAEAAPQGDPIEALAGKWDFKCGDKGCVMFTDILIGDPDHPSDPNHPEYIKVGVAINRSDRKPNFFSFEVPADADRKQGVIIAFLNTAKDGKGWKMVEDKDSMSQLDFNSCDEESCVARVHPEILSSDGSPELDLLDKFLHSSQIWFLFTKNGVPYRTMKALFPFQRDYRHLMETELKPTAP
jgi:invasion protein IalB